MIIFLRETGGTIPSVTGEGLKPLATSQTPSENSPQRDREGTDRRQRGHLWPESEQHAEIGK